MDHSIYKECFRVQGVIDKMYLLNFSLCLALDICIFSTANGANFYIYSKFCVIDVVRHPVAI